MSSKLGPHSLLPTKNSLEIIRAGCRIIKYVGDFGQAAEALQINPSITIIGRLHSSLTAEAQRASGQSPQVAARNFVNGQLPTYRLNPLITLWESHNEPVFDSLDDMRWYADFEIERMTLMESLGLQCVIANFATGNPGNLDLWPAFLPAVRLAREHGHVLGLHEYSSPWMWWMTGNYQINPPHPEPVEGSKGVEGWTTLRYRKVMRLYLAPVGLADVRIAITECGLDRVSPVPPGASSGNWRDNARWWGNQNGVGDPIPYWRGPERDPERYYAEQLIWYDRELRKDPNVIGATVFTFGSNNPAWNDYNISETRVAAYLIDYVRREASVPDPDGTPTPTGDTMPLTPLTQSDFNLINFQNIYTWDKDNAALPADQRGNTILIPNGLGFNYIWNPDTRIQWVDRKTGSPTFGQSRTQPTPNLKPEVVIMNPAQAADIRAGSIYVGDLVKAFKGWGAIWFILSAQLKDLIPGGKYKLAWPVYPDLVMSDDGQKVFADDPDAGYLRLRAEAGHNPLAFANPDQRPDDTWYDGTDFAYGRWKIFEKVFDAPGAQMTVALEAISTFGLKNSGFFIAKPTLELISSPTQPNTGGDPPTGTLLDHVTQIAAASAALTHNVVSIADETDKLKKLVGI